MPGHTAPNPRRPAGSHMCKMNSDTTTTTPLTPETREIVMRLERRERRHTSRGGLEKERAEHDQKGQHHQCNGAEQHKADRFQPQHPKTSPLAQFIGAVEPDAQALDSTRREIKRQYAADRDQSAVRGRQHMMDFGR